MKCKYALFILPIALGLAANADARGVSGSGNGGSGVDAGGALYVLDLVEAGAESDPYFDPAVPANPDFTARIQAALANVPAVPADLVSRKLQEIYVKYDHALPLAILKSMEVFDWRMLDFRLNPTDDSYSDVVEMDSTQHVQLAVRYGGFVKIDVNQWKRLNPANKAALILHEMIYALTDTQDDYRSGIARRSTGYLFTSELTSRGLQGYQSYVTNTKTDYMGRLYGLLPFVGQIPLHEVPVSSTEWYLLRDPQISVQARSQTGTGFMYQEPVISGLTLKLGDDATSAVTGFCNSLKSKSPTDWWGNSNLAIFDVNASVEGTLFALDSSGSFIVKAGDLHPYDEDHKDGSDYDNYGPLPRALDLGTLFVSQSYYKKQYDKQGSKPLPAGITDPSVCLSTALPLVQQTEKTMALFK